MISKFKKIDLPYNRISYKAEEFLLYDISDSATNYYLVALFYFTLLLMAYLKKKSVTYNRLRSLWYKKECSYFFSCFSGRGSNTL